MVFCQKLLGQGEIQGQILNLLNFERRELYIISIAEERGWVSEA